MNINTKCPNKNSRNTSGKWQNKIMFVMRTRNIQHAVTILRFNWISRHKWIWSIDVKHGAVRSKWNAMHWLQLQFWVAVNAICVDQHTDSYQKRIWTDICDVCGECGGFFVPIRDQIGDFICVLWVDQYNKFVIHTLFLDTEWTFLVHLTFWTVLVFLSLFSFSLVCFLNCLVNVKCIWKLGRNSKKRKCFFLQLNGSWMLF